MTQEAAKVLEILKKFNASIFKLKDDWMAENLDYEDVEMEVINILNEPFRTNIIKDHEILSCTIFDDYDNTCLALSKSITVLDMNYSAKLATKSLSHERNSLITKYSEYVACLNFQYFICEGKIKDRKFLSISLPDKSQ